MTYGNNIMQSEQMRDVPEDYFNVRNPLRNFRSYSTRWLITAHSTIESARRAPQVQDYVSQVGDDYSGGGIVIVNEAADTMVSVASITWQSLAAGIADVTGSMMMGQLSLTEPFGVSLLTNLVEWSQRLGTAWIGQTVFAARVSFVGHKDDGTDEMLTGYPGGDRALLFSLGSFDVALALEGVSYTAMMIMAINGNLLDAERSPIAALVSERENREEAAAAVQREEKADIAGDVASMLLDGRPLPPHLARHLAPGSEDRIRKQMPSLKLASTRTSRSDRTITIPLEFVDADGKVIARSFTVGPSTTAQSFAAEIGEVVASMVGETAFAETDGSGLTDSSDERQRAEKTRNRVLKSLTTVGQAFKQLEQTLNVAAEEWFQMQTQNAATNANAPTPIKYTYEFRVSEDLAASRLTNIKPKTQHAAGGETSEQQIDGPVNISFNQASTIDQIIHTILMHSVEVADRVATTEQRDGEIKQKETSEIVRIRHMRVEQEPGQPAKIIFLLSMADSAVPKDAANLSTKSLGGTVLEFDYLYGNRYTDLLEFDMSLDFGNLAVTRLFGPALFGADPSAGDASRTVSSVVAHPDAADPTRSTSQASSGSPYAENTAYAVKTQAFLQAISDAAMIRHSALTLRTMGDPYLCWDSMGSPSEYIDGTPPVGAYFNDHHNHPITVKVNIHYPVYQKQQSPSEPAGFYIQPFWYRKPYHLYGIQTTFSQSEGFVQELQLMFDSNQSETLF